MIQPGSIVLYVPGTVPSGHVGVVIDTPPPDVSGDWYIAWWFRSERYGQKLVPNIEETLLEVGWIDLTTGEVSALIDP